MANRPNKGCVGDTQKVWIVFGIRFCWLMALMAVYVLLTVELNLYLISLCIVPTVQVGAWALLCQPCWIRSLRTLWVLPMYFCVR